MAWIWMDWADDGRIRASDGLEVEGVSEIGRARFNEQRAIDGFYSIKGGGYGEEFCIS
jgi:hypothetical protein